MVHTVEYLILQPVKVLPVSPQQCRRLRNQSRGGKRKDLVSFCSKVLWQKGMDPEFIQRLVTGYQLHHLWPLGMGGKNNGGNLVLSEPNLHAGVHRLIDHFHENGRTLVAVHPTKEKIWIPPPDRKVEFRYLGHFFAKLTV